jgi:hypothetical protein
VEHSLQVHAFLCKVVSEVQAIITAVGCRIIGGGTSVCEPRSTLLAAGECPKCLQTLQAEERAEAEREAGQLAERRLEAELEALERKVAHEAEDAANHERQERARELDSVRIVNMAESLVLITILPGPWNPWNPNILAAQFSMPGCSHAGAPLPAVDAADQEASRSVRRQSRVTARSENER